MRKRKRVKRWKAGGRRDVPSDVQRVNRGEGCVIGWRVEFQNEGAGVITDETVDAIYITSAFFTGWMFKAEYFDLLGIED